MFTHVVVGSNDLPRSKQFYDALFTSVGGNPGMDLGERIAVVQLAGGALILGAVLLLARAKA